MTLEEIRANWTNNAHNKQAVVNMWDAMADHYKEKELPQKEDKFIQLLERKDILTKKSKVLDIGCGTGKYSMSVAQKAESVTGIDLSPKMIEYGREILKKNNVSNVQLICDDWQEIDLKSVGLENAFDLTFAHMTPAISDAVSFQKMIDASSRYCALCKPTKRTDSVSDKLRQIAGIEKNNCDEEFMYMFDYIWQSGYLPLIEYDNQHWHTQRELKEAKKVYINRIAGYKDIDDALMRELEGYLKDIAKDDIVTEDIDTTVAIIYWEK